MIFPYGNSIPFVLFKNKFSKRHKSFSLPTRKRSSSLSPRSQKNQKPIFVDLRFLRAPGVGIEPTTNRLTGDRSTAELPRNIYSTFTLSPARLNDFSRSGRYPGIFILFLERTSLILTENREKTIKEIPPEQSLKIFTKFCKKD